jgi:hypothetical protein
MGEEDAEFVEFMALVLGDVLVWPIFPNALKQKKL